MRDETCKFRDLDAGDPPPDRVSVLFADEHSVVVDKPAGLVVHPTYKRADGTLLDILRQQLPDPPSIVGRLDRWTSGVVVVARHSVAHAALQRAMTSSDCEKDYLAVVHGRVSEDVEIDLKLRVDEGDRRRVLASPQVGATSLTRVVAVGIATVNGREVSLVRCRLVTGRRHQIRVHLAARGWPVVADPTYGDPSRDRVLAAAIGAPCRQALHSWRLRMAHSRSDSRLEVVAPLPDDLEPLTRLFALSELAAAS